MPTINDAFRFELDLSTEQVSLCARSAGTARYAYNWGLAERIRRFETREGKDRFISGFSQINEWVAQKPAWAYEVSAWCAVSALQDLERAFKNFRAARKAGRKVGFPRFKAKGRTRESFRLRGSIAVLDERHVQLPTLGAVRIKGSTRRRRAIGYERIRYATVSRVADRWFVSILVERQHIVPAAPDGEPVGIDVGLRTSLVLSTGEEIQGPRALKAGLRHLRRANKALARSQRNSKGHEKARSRVARIQADVANVRRDWQHKLTDRLTREFGVIGREDLVVRSLAHKKRRQGRAWADLGIGELFRQLDYKAARRGVVIVVADRFFPSSQLCSSCGHRQAMSLKVRTYVCPACGLVLDRDQNAARNLRPVAVTPTETLNARGENVSPEPVWRISMKREPDITQRLAAA